MSNSLQRKRFSPSSRFKSRSNVRLQVEQLETRCMMVGDAILHWNGIALDVVAASHTKVEHLEQLGPTATSRSLAIVHTAMYDAINSVLGEYEPYLIKVVGVSDADIDAAVGTAAHHTLVALYPKQKTAIDRALTEWLDEIPNGNAEDLGIALGKTVALAMLNSRANDGSNGTSTYEYSDNVPGRHQTDPVTFEASGIKQDPLTPYWGKVKPFGIKNATSFYPAAPPSMTSDVYRAAFDEVNIVGAKNAETTDLDNNGRPDRTSEQTEIGIFWAYDGTQGLCAPPRLYNQVAREIAEQQNNTEYENARMFTMLNVAMADAGIVGWGAKYEYDYWRPVVAIRGANGDGNPNTVGNPTWTPLGAPASNRTFPNDFTPPFPAYISGHAIFGAALFQTMARFYGRDDIAFSFTSDEFNGTTTDNNGVVRPSVTRTFSRLSDASFENAISRVYLGIHWRFDATEGITAGNRIADNIFNRLFQPLKNALPAGSSRTLVTDYLKTEVMLLKMQLGDGVNRETVMLQSKTTARSTVYTVSALWDAPSIFGKKGRGSQTIYVVGSKVNAGTQFTSQFDTLSLAASSD